MRARTRDLSSLEGSSESPGSEELLKLDTLPGHQGLDPRTMESTLPVKHQTCQ